jgi:uncharacterized nucleotidyltransferase DUF6036
MFYVELFQALEREAVRYLLVGGVAVNLHGAERLTMDVDIMLALDAENLRRFLSAIEPLGLRPANPLVTIEQFCDSAIVESWIRDKHMLAFQFRPKGKEPSLDILVKPVVPFEAAYARRVRMDAEGVVVNVAAPVDLIALKSGTGREIDRSDIRALQRLEMLRSRLKDD